MKNYIFLVLFFVQASAFGQNKFSTFTFNNFVNPPTFHNLLANSVTKNKIQIEYGTFGLDVSCSVIKGNIRNSLNWMVSEGMVPYVAQNYTEGGTWEGRVQLANGIVYDIIFNRNPIVGNPSANYLRNEPFAQDWELFQTVNLLPREKSSILSSNDTYIPVNIISNHPMLLVNGIKKSEIISTSKSIKIK